MLEIERKWERGRESDRRRERKRKRKAREERASERERERGRERGGYRGASAGAADERGCGVTHFKRASESSLDKDGAAGWRPHLTLGALLFKRGPIKQIPISVRTATSNTPSYGGERESERERGDTRGGEREESGEREGREEWIGAREKRGEREGKIVKE